MEAFLVLVAGKIGSALTQEASKAACSLWCEASLLTGEQSHCEFICGAIKKGANIRAWCPIAARLKQIEDDLAHAATMKERYDIKKLDFGFGSSPNYVNQREWNPASPSYAVELR